MKLGRPPRAIAIAVAVLVVSLALDLGSKEWVLHSLSEERSGAAPPLCETDEHGRLMAMQRLRHGVVGLVPSHLELRYAENCGAAFGLGNSLPRDARAALFYLAALIAIVALSRRFLMGGGGPPFAASVPFIASGALGNLTDRIRHGYVVDFIRFWWGTFEYPTFNVADAAITVGVVLMLLDELKRPPKKVKDVAEVAAKPQADG